MNRSINMMNDFVKEYNSLYSNMNENKKKKKIRLNFLFFEIKKLKEKLVRV